MRTYYANEQTWMWNEYENNKHLNTKHSRMYLRILDLSLFLALQHSSEVVYDNIHNAVQKRYPDSEVPSLYRVKKLIHTFLSLYSEGQLVLQPCQ